MAASNLSQRHILAAMWTVTPALPSCVDATVEAGTEDPRARDYRVGKYWDLTCTPYTDVHYGNGLT